MAQLTPDELASLRALVQNDTPSLPYIKPIVNAGLQGMEDYWENTGRAAAIAAVKAALVAAGAPGATNAEARRIVKQWLRDKFGRGG